MISMFKKAWFILVIVVLFLWGAITYPFYIIFFKEDYMPYQTFSEYAKLFVELAIDDYHYTFKIGKYRDRE